MGKCLNFTRLDKVKGGDPIWKEELKKKCIPGEQLFSLLLLQKDS